MFETNMFRDIGLILFCETKRNETKYMREGEKMLSNLNTT